MVCFGKLSVKMMLAIEMRKRMTNSITHNQAVTSSKRFFFIACISPWGSIYDLQRSGRKSTRRFIPKEVPLRFSNRIES